MKRLSLLILLGAALGACKKDSENAPSRLDLLTSKVWRVTAQTTTVTTGTTTTSNTGITVCSQDDGYKFNAEKTLVIDAGVTKCATSDPQKENALWDFSNADQTRLKITRLTTTGLSGDFDIKELSPTVLHIYNSQVINGITYTVDATLAPY